MMPTVNELCPTEPDDELSGPGCDCCGNRNADGLAVYTKNPPIPYRELLGNDRYMVLCRLCANTYIGSSYEYPDREATHDILKAINYVGNEILKAIRSQGTKDA